MSTEEIHTPRIARFGSYDSPLEIRIDAAQRELVRLYRDLRLRRIDPAEAKAGGWILSLLLNDFRRQQKDATLEDLGARIRELEALAA